MHQQQKDRVKTAAAKYIKDHRLSQKDVAIKAGIPEAYLSAILNGKYSHKAGDNEVVIADKYFAALADTVGCELEKRYWHTLPTIQMQEMLTTLEAAKSSARPAMITGATGVGKTYVTDLFCRQYPRHTYRITVSSIYKLPHIVNELCLAIGVDVSLQNATFARSINHYSMKLRLDAMVEKLADIRAAGGQPIIIMDEAENLETATLKAIKGLYDALKGQCAIVLIGTEQLTTRLLYRVSKGHDGLPQLWRRFKAGHRHLAPISKEQAFGLFFDKLGIHDKGLRKLLCQLADNYGELNDYLEPALREADQRGEVLTEDLFRIIYNMPKAS